MRDWTRAEQRCCFLAFQCTLKICTNKTIPEGCLFTLLIVSFDVQKLLRLIRSHLFILIISLLVIIIFLFLPHKHFNCYTIVCTSDFQNVNRGCNASTNPSGWVLSVYCTSIRLSIFLSMNYFIIPENQKLSPSKKGN